MGSPENVGMVAQLYLEKRAAGHINSAALEEDFRPERSPTLVNSTRDAILVADEQKKGHSLRRDILQKAERAETSRIGSSGSTEVRMIQVKRVYSGPSK